MNQDTFNMSMRKFLKKVGVTSQHEIEKAVEDALQSKVIKGNETLPASVTLNIDTLGVSVKIEGNITLE